MSKAFDLLLFTSTPPAIVEQVRSLRVTHRQRGVIPGCVPAPHDKTLLEELGLKPASCVDEISALFDRYHQGGYKWERFMADYAMCGKLNH